MTGDLYEGCPEVLQVIEPDDIEWLLNEIGQRFQTLNPRRVYRELSLHRSVIIPAPEPPHHACCHCGSTGGPTLTKRRESDY